MPWYFGPLGLATGAKNLPRVFSWALTFVQRDYVNGSPRAAKGFKGACTLIYRFSQPPPKDLPNEYLEGPSEFKVSYGSWLLAYMQS